jgi:murein DD-endopeptidase MepM/ murein hydrolase activator NlpD
MSARGALFVAVVIVLVLMVGCRKTGPTAVAARPTDASLPLTETSAPPSLVPTASATPTATASATPTATASATPTATPTPTPTALPITVSGDPRKAVLRTPAPQSGAPCGVVDILDFPLDPPDARNVAFGGRDFGVFRSRFDGYHTGEDWRGGSGRASFGAPVYSIGHGMVTYAQPLGWGADKGVVIVRHVLSDGSTVLSMYGHLDPPSVVLNVGDCVARGDQVGQIGKPRTPPHLHFEVRTHMPDRPGPGYWSVDPTLAGWLPPSQYIWNNRIASSPGVQWTRPAVARGTKGIGMLDHDTFGTIEDNQLVGINVMDGSLRWSQPITINVVDAAIDESQSAIYVSNYVGKIEAFRLPNSSDGTAVGMSELSSEPVWEIDLDEVGLAKLMPLPGGGVMAAFRQQMIGISPAGKVLWKHDAIGRVYDWTLADGQLFFSTAGVDGSIWMADDSGLTVSETQLSGRLVTAGDQVWVYDGEGIYRLKPGTLSSELRYALPRGSPILGDIVALPDGGVLVVHTDPFDKRLIALNADGTLRWQRSVFDVIVGQQRLRLLVADGRPYLISQHDAVPLSEVSVFSLDLRSAELVRIFTGGSRNPSPNDTWAFGANDRILINIGGSCMAGLDTQLAIEALEQVAPF